MLHMVNVAIAAPRIPRAGNPNNPKIKIALKTTLHKNDAR